MNDVVLEIAERKPFAEGAGFGEAGAYERLKGRAHFAVDPDAPAQTAVTDLQFAPRDDDGRVSFAADFFILKPVDPAKGNKRLFFDWGNRGNKRALQFFNDAPAANDPLTIAHAGNGFLFRRGYAIAWAGWQGDLYQGDGRMLLDVPIARSADGPITGWVRGEFIVGQAGVSTFPLSGMTSVKPYPAISTGTSCAILTRRRYPDDERQTIPPARWRFAREARGQGLDEEEAESAIIPSAEHIYLEDGFKPGWIYELIYEARDPRVLGLGYVAVRDFLAFLRHEKDETANPLAGSVEKIYGWGRSQAGRAIREFIYRGFNADAAGKRVFDGVMPHVSGAGRMWLNHRFANGSAMAGQQYEGHHNFADRFPFSYAETTDHLTGRTDAILKRPETDPLVIHTQSATEYWQRRGSLVHTDTRGNDLGQPATVRLYVFSSSQHFAPVTKARPQRGPCQLLANVVPTSFFFRALLDALDQWASDGTPPPASQIPRRADGTLVSYSTWRTQFPAIPGYAVPVSANPLPLLDFGADEDAGLLTKEPPQVLDERGYAVLVPAVDQDGNDIAGLRAPMVEAPLATYMGWNLRQDGRGKGAMYQFTGGTIPFAGTMSERRMSGDPRPSVEERYADADVYRNAICLAARRLAEAGFLLEEDVERICEEARDWDRPRHDVGI
ncbi:MAG: alpha/beta hydrolase domain-containing protein [Rhodomicrobiaceae bacterium]